MLTRLISNLQSQISKQYSMLPGNLFHKKCIFSTFLKNDSNLCSPQISDTPSSHHSQHCTSDRRDSTRLEPSHLSVVNLTNCPLSALKYSAFTSVKKRRQIKLCSTIRLFLIPLPWPHRFAFSFLLAQAHSQGYCSEDFPGSPSKFTLSLQGVFRGAFLQH